MTEMVNKWTEEEFCREFWASVDEFYGRWKENSGGRLPDWEAAIARGKRDGIPPHPAYEPHPGEVIREGDVHGAPKSNGLVRECIELILESVESEDSRDYTMACIDLAEKLKAEGFGLKAEE